MAQPAQLGGIGLRGRIARSALFIAVLAVTVATCLGWLDPRADMINRANSLLREGSYEEALRLYENVVVEYPDDLTGRLNSAIALYAAGRYAESSARFQDVLQRLSSKDAEQPAEITDSIAKLCRYGAGSAEFRLGSTADEGASNPETSSGAALDHYRRAVNHFYEALKMDPDDEDARHNYRLAYEKLKELEQSLQSRESGDAGDNEDSGQDRPENHDQGDTRPPDQHEQMDQDQQDGQDQDEQEEQGQDQPQNRQDNQSQKESPDNVGMSREEALHLLEMMGDEETSVVLNQRAGAGEPEDYPNW